MRYDESLMFTVLTSMIDHHHKARYRDRMIEAFETGHLSMDSIPNS
jgi:hypothetical protein